MSRFNLFLIGGLFLIFVGTAFGQVGTLTFRTEIAGAGVWMDGSTLAIAPGAPFYINIYANNVGGVPRLGWSSPFKFTFENSTHTVIWGDTALFATSQLKSLWNLLKINYVESWDGNLPDLYCFVGVAVEPAGYPGNLDEILVFHIPITISCEGNKSGYFCIEQGDPVNQVYAWTFEDPVPTYDKICWEIKEPPCGLAPVMDSCPVRIIAVADRSVSYQFHATDIDGDLKAYEITSGPGAIDPVTGLWHFEPYLSQAWQMIPLDVRARDDCYVYHQCSGTEYCHTQVAVNGICGDVDGNGLVNILDIARVINCIYQLPPGTCHYPWQVIDVNNNGAVNILDLSYLINFLYKHGPAPVCPAWYE
ncbi:hypothetical protein TRIP_C20604 [Candidatus Zixiibacteriota bacterium]|nr:hypothetical protein TRIP_C20604 [candidate division Zixibacteria bacterium]